MEKRYIILKKAPRSVWSYWFYKELNIKSFWAHIGMTILGVGATATSFGILFLAKGRGADLLLTGLTFLAVFCFLMALTLIQTKMKMNISSFNLIKAPIDDSFGSVLISSRSGGISYFYTFERIIGAQVVKTEVDFSNIELILAHPRSGEYSFTKLLFEDVADAEKTVQEIKSNQAIFGSNIYIFLCSLIGLDRK